MRHRFSQNYREFSPDERMRLTLAAAARNDHEEARRLMATCPQMKFVGADPEFSRRLLTLSCVSGTVLLCWLDVSHFVVRSSNAISMFELVTVAGDLDLVDGAADAHIMKNLGVQTDELVLLELQHQTLVRQCRAVTAKVEATHKIWSARWKGIEAAIAKFSTECELTVDEFFALNGPLLPAIAEARGVLAPDAAADDTLRTAIYDQLRQAWWDSSKPSRDRPHVEQT